MSVAKEARAVLMMRCPLRGIGTLHQKVGLNEAESILLMRCPLRGIGTLHHKVGLDESQTGLLVVAAEGAESDRTDEVKQKAIEFVRWKCYWSNQLEETSVRIWKTRYMDGRKTSLAKPKTNKV